MSNANGPIEDHRRAVADSWQRFMRGEFDPWNIPPHLPRGEDRMVAAMEYAAYQLGEINQKLSLLIELTHQQRYDRR